MARVFLATSSPSGWTKLMRWLNLNLRMMSRMLRKRRHPAVVAGASDLAVVAALLAGAEATGKSLCHSYFWKPGYQPGFFFARQTSGKVRESAGFERHWSENLSRKKAKKRVHKPPIRLTDAWVLLNFAARLFVCTSANQVASRSREKGNQSLFDNCMIRDDLPVDSSFPPRNLVCEA